MNTQKTLVTLIAAVMLMSQGSAMCDGMGRGASTEWTYGAMDVDIPGFEIPCVAEPLRILGSWPYKQHDVRTPGGTEGYVFQFTPTTPAGGVFVLIGEITGRVYSSQNGMPAIETFRLGRGEVYHFRSHERYLAEDGERLTIDWHITAIANGNGELVLDAFELDCH